ncbi:MAG: GNAT family N-acetyltransferase [Pseudomonadales bacterium]
MSDSSNTYSENLALPDGTAVSVRLMAAADRDAVVAFAQSLPEEDLLFLSVDITQPSAVDDWIEGISAGRNSTLVAYQDDRLIGYAMVQRNPAPWTRRVGEIRVNVAPDFRARGLGRILTSRIFDLARGLALKKLMARMTTEQHGAQAAFRKLGFVPEALLADFVEDRNGVSRDLVMMTFDVDGHTDQAGSSVRI